MVLVPAKLTPVLLNPSHSQERMQSIPPAKQLSCSRRHHVASCPRGRVVGTLGIGERGGRPMLVTGAMLAPASLEQENFVEKAPPRASYHCGHLVSSRAGLSTAAKWILPCSTKGFHNFLLLQKEYSTN